MHNIKTIQLAVLLILPVILFSSCGSDMKDITIRSDTWPDGTSITFISENRIIAESKLYGGRLRLALPDNIEFTIRAASPDHIYSISKPHNSSDEQDDYILPRPIKRYRYGSWRFGFGTNEAITDTSPLRKDDATSRTHTVTVPLQGNSEYMVSKPGDELIASVSLTSETLNNFSALCDSAVVYAVDGLLLDPDTVIWEISDSLKKLRNCIETIHDRGMTCDIRHTVSCAAGSVSLPPALLELMRENRGPSNPDELRIAFACDSIPAFASVEKIEETVMSLYRQKIPLSGIAVEISPGARKYRIAPDGSLMQMELKADEIDRFYRKMGEKNFLRLSDGSIRFGDSGSMFELEDYTGMAEKITRLRHGPLRDCAGVHVMFDTKCLKPTMDELEHLALSLLQK